MFSCRFFPEVWHCVEMWEHSNFTKSCCIDLIYSNPIWRFQKVDSNASWDYRWQEAADWFLGSVNRTTVGFSQYQSSLEVWEGKWYSDPPFPDMQWYAFKCKLLKIHDFLTRYIVRNGMRKSVWTSLVSRTILWETFLLWSLHFCRFDVPDCQFKYWPTVLLKYDGPSRVSSFCGGLVRRKVLCQAVVSTRTFSNEVHWWEYRDGGALLAGALVVWCLLRSSGRSGKRESVTRVFLIVSSKNLRLFFFYKS